MQQPLQIRVSPERKTLSKEDLAPLLSEFLVDGWAKQRYEIVEVKSDPESLDAKINITNFCASKNDSGSFYLSNTLVFPIISQLSIIHILHILGQNKQFPVWLREYNIETLRRIKKQEALRFRLQCIDRFEARSFKDEGHTGLLVNYLYRFEVDEGAFVGRIWAAFRRPSE